jgi:hypothetical protein
LHVLSNPIKPICLGYFSEILFVEEYNMYALSYIFLKTVLVLYIFVENYMNVIKVCQTDTYINMYLPIKEVFSCHNVRGAY